MDGRRTGESADAELARLRDEIERLRQQNAELLEALQYYARYGSDGLVARLAIAKATGGK